jgi:hypothetical protein
MSDGHCGDRMACLDLIAMVLLDGFIYDPLDATMFKYTLIEVDDRNYEKEISSQAAQDEGG